MLMEEGHIVEFDRYVHPPPSSLVMEANWGHHALQSCSAVERQNKQILRTVQSNGKQGIWSAETVGWCLEWEWTVVELTTYGWGPHSFTRNQWLP
jgi:hypothetical protein